MGTMAEQPILSWEDVAHRYGRKIYTFAYRLTGNPDDAADLVQDVLIRVRKGLDGYTPGSFEVWLWRITRNAFLDGVRSGEGELARLIFRGLAPGATPLDFVPDP